MLENYEKSVYAGLLGKVIGVYLGRPFEGWSKEKIEEKWGEITEYVHADLDYPLVVADDDISGTIAFARALSDSELYEETPDDFYGKTWLNYLIEDKTVLWWGGIGVSTEHTAWLRLKDGVSSPESGSLALNGKTVSDQIGGQIFIEAFGLVAPDNPDLAVKLAEKAARVSHDGEGVYGALVVAAMVSMAFTEKNMDVLLDRAIEYVPENSVIAAVHNDVRAWCKVDGDWRVTYEKIKEKYGYTKFGGGCHMIPNHAIMVMAWCYAPDNFYESQKIINTAGWDTDCNAANVGSVMGVKLGLEEINKDYDFQKPFADRIMVPTADGTDSFTDVLNAAGVIADMGKKIHKEPIAEVLPVHHFSMPGALHGYEIEGESDDIEISNQEIRSGQRGLCVFVKNFSEKSVIVSTPILTRTFGLKKAYDVVGTASLVSGKKITMTVVATDDLEGFVDLCLVIRTFDQATFEPTAIFREATVSFRAGDEKELEMVIPDLKGWPIYDMGFEIISKSGKGKLFVASVVYAGKPNIVFETELNFQQKGDGVNACAGWISTMDGLRSQRGWQEGVKPYLTFSKNKGTGFLITGDRSWEGYAFNASLKPVVTPGSLGVIVNYQGLERYIAFIYRNNRFELIERYYEDRLLGAIDKKWCPESKMSFSIVCKANKIEVFVNDVCELTSETHQLNCGGVGFICEKGRANVFDVSVVSN